MERLFTEREWRAIAEIEQRAGMFAYPAESEKRILGPAFTAGEFVLARRVEYTRSDFIGPPAAVYWAYEKASRVRLTSDVADRCEALSAARRRLSNIPPDILARMLSEGRQRHAAARAEEEARAAIAKAKADTKAARKLKIGRRRRAIFAACDGRCHYCRIELQLTGDWHVDHKMPKALGGSNEAINLVACCAPCNRTKHDKTDVEFLALREQGVL